MEEQSVHSSTSDINSEEAAATEPLIIPRKKRICLVGSTGEDPALGAAAQQFSVPVLKSEQGTEYVEDTTYCTYYILSKFEGADYDTLHKTAHRILGPTALLQLAEKKESLPSINRPMYTQSMLGTIVVFTGFRKKEELTRLINMIHNMGGSIRKDMGNKVTHLIANCCGGDKYRYAITFRIPIMSSDWVLELWNARDDVASSSSNDKLIADYKLKPFFGAKVCFFGFPDDEKTHMYEVLQQQGGEPAEIDDPNCTHVVVDESNVNSLPDLASVRAHIVKAEWFWTSVQNEGAAYEKDYLFEDYLESVMSPMAMARRDSQAATPRTASTKRKRKRMAETLCSLVQNGADSPAVHKRRSSISDAGHLSVSGSFLDCTSSPDKQLDAIPEVEAVSTEAGRKNLSPRHQVFLELVTTESNYVGILSTIMTLFKEPLEDLIEMSGELLNSTEAKIIFGNFPPIYEVHKKMLEELRYNASHWAEDVSIGNIFLKYAPDLVKAYPPYVNFFENTKEMLDQCDQNKPRFHAFLKICQTKPECGRQSLKELLIKPVQRLPSISLLLNECQKVFALMVRSNQELKEKLFSFTITDEEVNKTNYLRTLCRQMANSVCKADADTFLISLDSHQLEIDTSDVALGTLSKAFKSLFHNFYLEYMDPYVFLLNSMCETTLHVPLPFASRTRMKVGRAFSFNKTPSKLKRAMSTMMSPFGSTNSLTPASQQLAQMRLASCNNINELGNGGSGSPTRDEVLVAPMSVQPTRKAKCSSLSMASLRRNCSEEVVQDKSEL
ncbi:protein ECT2 isoform X8 [Neodiprion fabricii]|uniref:protein ECT2 isoform X8 n=1 Tax=Neodiprion fabricii TaxID=2872261 RepID=UPI001ED905DC|nr:protein ECT2 isoform X8 [Neodiprion fabricii]